MLRHAYRLERAAVEKAYNSPGYRSYHNGALYSDRMMSARKDYSQAKKSARLANIEIPRATQLEALYELQEIYKAERKEIVANAQRNRTRSNEWIDEVSLIDKASREVRVLINNL